jgi:hypothetical protein
MIHYAKSKTGDVWLNQTMSQKVSQNRGFEECKFCQEVGV